MEVYNSSAIFCGITTSLTAFKEAGLSGLRQFLVTESPLKMMKNVFYFTFKENKGNHTMTFGQLIEYNMRNIFLKNHTQNVVEKLFPDPFL